jgi:hypothetical protein
MSKKIARIAMISIARKPVSCILVSHQQQDLQLHVLSPQKVNRMRTKKQTLGQPYLSARHVRRLSNLHAALRYIRVWSIVHRASAIYVSRYNIVQSVYLFACTFLCLAESFSLFMY